MRKNLGSIIVFIVLIFYLDLSASAYKWSSSSSKNNAYTNEIVYLKYTCKFSDKGELFTILLEPAYDVSKYTATLLKKNDILLDGKRISTYEYLVKAKVPGKLNLNLNASMLQTTIESIVDSSGSRDDDRGEQDFIEKRILLKAPEVNIKDSGSDIVGLFDIKVSADAPSVQAYEPYHMSVEISGLGNLDEVKAIEYKINDVKIFTQKPFLKLEHKKEGFEGSWSQKFVFVGANDFQIPEMKIQYFDIATQKLHDLKIASRSVNVTKVYKKSELLDDVEEEKPIDFSFVYYILTFIAGFLVAKINFKRKKTNSKDKLFIEKISATKSIKELSVILILENERKFSSLLGELDSTDSISLSQAKSKVLKLIQD